MEGRSLDGWLSKLTSTRSGSSLWQRRWFVLEADRLLCFHSPADAGTAGGEPKWSLDLRSHGASVSAEPGEPARFELRAEQQTIALKADSEVEAEMWRCALETPPPAATPAAGLFDGLAMSGGAHMETSGAPVSSAFGFMASSSALPQVSSDQPPAHSYTSALPLSPNPRKAEAVDAREAAPVPSGSESQPPVRKKKVVRKAKHPGGFGEEDTQPPPLPPPPAPLQDVTPSASAPSSLSGNMFDGMNLGAGASADGSMFDGMDVNVGSSAAPPPPPPPPAEHVAVQSPTSSTWPHAPSPHAQGSAHASALSSSGCSSLSGESSHSDEESAATRKAPSATFEGAASVPSSSSYPTSSSSLRTSALGLERLSTGGVLSAVGDGYSAVGGNATAYGPSGAYAFPLDRTSGDPGHVSTTTLRTSVPPPGGSVSDEKRRKHKNGTRRTSSSPSRQQHGIGALSLVTSGAPEALDVDAAMAESRLQAGKMRTRHAALCVRQGELLRRQTAHTAELRMAQDAKVAAKHAQAEASAAEDYERAAALGAEIESREAREMELTNAMAEEESAYQEAEEEKAVLLKAQSELWDHLLQACRRCHSARNTVAAHEAESRSAQLAEQASAIRAERERLTAEAEALAAKEAALAAKREDAQRTIKEEARAPIAERAHWQDQEDRLEKEIAALLQQVERKRAEQAEASKHVAQCTARIAAVEARFDKQLKKVEAKAHALSAAQEVHTRAAHGLDAASAAYDAEVRAVDDERIERQAWVEAAEAAIAAAEEEVKQQEAVAAVVQRVAQAAQALLDHRSDEAAALSTLQEELAACQQAQRAHTEAVVQMEADAELLGRQLGALLDHQVRLERDKRLAVAAQKFADAARVASELKTLAVKLETDELARKHLLGQAESARAAQQSHESREAELTSRVRGEQQLLDKRKFQLLCEHEEALRAALPVAESAQAELLKTQLASSEASRQAICIKWGWDGRGNLLLSSKDAGTMGLNGAEARALDGNTSESSEDSGDEAAAVPTSLRHDIAHVPSTVRARPHNVLSSLISSGEGANAIQAALHDSDDDSENEEVLQGERCGQLGELQGLQGAGLLSPVSGVRGRHSNEANGTAKSPTPSQSFVSGMGLGPFAQDAQGEGPSPTPPIGFTTLAPLPASSSSPLNETGVAGGSCVTGERPEDLGAPMSSTRQGVEQNDRESIKRLLDYKEDAMQEAVDNDDFEKAAQLQEEIDELNDRLEALA